MYAIDQQIGADQLWRQGVTGSGVDIAVIDTGVAPVPGLAGKIINGPDLSLDHPYAKVDGIDAFGHGTHIASIAAGLDAGTKNLSDPSKFVGVAPGARIVNVKVGAFDGATDVSQVIAGIDWVVQHKNDNGLNIKVLNLSYGTESTNSSYDDPLSWAAEAAYRNGIVVVAAAGNDGGRVRVLSPAYNPVVLAVGSVDQAKQPLTASDFTNGGFLKPDIWAPGEHILGLRVPGSFLDARFPTARVGTRLFRGSGTSQATAVVSGSAALLAAAHPEATPSQISNAIRMSAQDVNGKITGFIDVAKADSLLDQGKIPDIKPVDLTKLATLFGKTLPPPGTGSLEASRGGEHLIFNLVPLVGEVDIFGKAWDATASSAAALAGSSWSGGVFNGSSWSGSSWSGSSWSGSSWSGSSWSGSSWSSNTWAGSSWSGSSWSGSSWSGSSWSGSSWSGSSWSGNSWSGSSWSGSGWRGNVWG